MIPMSGLRLDPLVPVSGPVVVEHVDDPGHRDAREAAFVEELLPGTAEEPLCGGVVGRTSFRTHGTRQIAFHADADPFGPPVVVAAIRMDDWFLSVLERGARVGERAVGQHQARVPGPSGGMVGDAPVRQVDQQAHVRPASADADIGKIARQMRVRGVAVGPAGPAGSRTWLRRPASCAV